MSKVIAVFDIDEEKLEEVENGSIENAFGWLSDSGVYLYDYEKLEEENIQLHDLLKSQEENRIKIIEAFKSRMSDLCEKCPTGIDRLSSRPLYAKEGENVWRDLIDDAAEELINKSSEQSQTQAPIKM